MADLITLAEAREALAATEPLAMVSFAVLSDGGREAPSVSFAKDWARPAAGEDEQIEPTRPVPAWLHVPELGETFQLSFQAAQQLGSTCKQPRQLQVAQPAALHEQIVNWWLSEGLGQQPLKLLLAGTGEDEAGRPVPLAVAQTRATVEPFSNLALVDQAQAVVARTYGREAAEQARVHFTLSHDLEHTDVRLVLESEGREVPGTGDVWCPVVEITNSCIGAKQLTVTGGLMRADTAAIALDGGSSAGGFKRKGSTPEQAYEWAAESVGDVLRGLGESYANLAELARRPVEHVGTFTGSLCSEFRVPKGQLQRITATLEDFAGELSMYELAGSIARIANMEELGWRGAGLLMLVAGHLVHSVGGRCSKDHPCYRALPQGFESPQD